jgi:hypothetical protein
MQIGSWTGLWLTLAFVFVTIAAPLHLLAADVGSAQAMTGMQACHGGSAHEKAVQSKNAASKETCAYGCACPLSHCPGTLDALAPVQTIAPRLMRACLTPAVSDRLRPNPPDALKRPPRLTT